MKTRNTVSGKEALQWSTRWKRCDKLRMECDRCDRNRGAGQGIYVSGHRKYIVKRKEDLIDLL